MVMDLILMAVLTAVVLRLVDVAIARLMLAAVQHPVMLLITIVAVHIHTLRAERVCRRAGR